MYNIYEMLAILERFFQILHQFLGHMKKYTLLDSFLSKFMNPLSYKLSSILYNNYTNNSLLCILLFAKIYMYMSISIIQGFRTF